MGGAACVSLCDCFLHLRLSQEPASHQSNEVSTEAFVNTILLLLGFCGIKYIIPEQKILLLQLKCRLQLLAAFAPEL